MSTNHHWNTGKACQQRPLLTSASTLVQRFHRLTSDQRRLLTSFLNLLAYDRDRERAADESPFDREVSFTTCLAALTPTLSLTDQSALNTALSTVFLGD
jgi:hypothetical protein